MNRPHMFYTVQYNIIYIIFRLYLDYHLQQQILYSKKHHYSSPGYIP